MNELGPVSKHLENELRELARQHGIVIWLDKSGHYARYADGLMARAQAGQFPFPTRCFRGSYLQLMRELDGLEDGVGPKPLVVHVPGLSEEEIAKTPLLELYRAGRRERFGLPKLVKDAAYGRATVEQLEAFLASEPLTLEGADAWLAGIQGAAPTEGRDLSSLSSEALVDALLPGGTLVEEAAAPEVQRAIWRRAEMLLGLSPEARDRFRDGGRLAPGERGNSVASDILLEIVGWTLAVEFVHDLKRAPRAAWLTPLATLPAPVVESCRKLAKHLRSRHTERYPTWADEVEARMEEELEAATAADLGQIDTFRFEDRKVLAAALEALEREDYLAAHQWALARGAGKSFWTQHDRARFQGWHLVELAAQLGCEIQKHTALLEGVTSHSEAVERYSEQGYRVDAAQRRLEQAREQASVLEIEEFPALRNRLDQVRHVYRRWADTQAMAFNRLCREQGFLPSASLQQRTLFDDVVRPWARELGCTAYFMVDALRFELAEQLAGALGKARSATVSLKARLSELPSVTEVGMNVLAPVAQGGKLRVDVSSKGEIRGFRGGQARISGPDDRQKAIHERVGGKTCPKLTLEELLSRDVSSLRKTVAEAKLLIVHAEGLDKAGEKGVGLLVFEQELRKLRAAWGLLLQAGVLRAVITADHGFLLHDATTRAPLTHGFKTDPKRRHVVSFEHLDRPGEVAVGARDLGYELDDNVWFLFPETAAPFDRGEKAKDFVHGGNSLQERVIPVLTVQHKHALGTTTGSYRIEAKAKEPAPLASRAHCLELVVSMQGQTGLSFGAAKELELALMCEDDPTVQVQLTDAIGARLTGNLLVAPVERPFEVFFRLTGAQAGRVRVRAQHATGELHVEAAVTSERFGVDALVPARASEPAAGSKDAPKQEPKPTPAVRAGKLEAWLLELPEGGVREVFRHLDVHGSVNEAEATRMLGGGRQFRAFSRKFEEFARVAPFGIFVQTLSGTKCYVRGDR